MHQNGSVLGWLECTNDGCILGCVEGFEDGITEDFKDGSILSLLDITNDGCLVGCVDGCEDGNTEILGVRSTAQTCFVQ